jgi:hypothetical protein
MSLSINYEFLKWLFSDFKIEIIAKFEPKIFPTEKAFPIKSKFPQKITTKAKVQ